MTDPELIAYLNSGIEDAVINSGSYIRKQEDQLSYYNGDLFGDEVDGRSQAVKTDVADVIDADMVSLTRILLGARSPIKFKPKTTSLEDVEEAKQKTKYINHLVRHKAGGFEKLFKWLKGAGIHDISVMKYFVEEKDHVETHKWDGITSDQLQSFIDTVDDGEVVITAGGEPDENGLLGVELSVIKKRNEVGMHHVPPESFIISRNTESYKDADVIGDRDSTRTRGDLIADGYNRNDIARIPSLSTSGNDKGTLKQIRFDDEGGAIIDDYNQWALERVEIYNLFAMVDYNGDGVAERRNIIFGGTTILYNEPFDHVPYAVLSAYPMMHKAIGESRASKVMQTQRINSVILRQGLDNLYQVNNPKTLVSDNVDQDELLSSTFGGYVTVDTSDSGVPPSQASFALTVPPVYQGALTMLQWMDQSRSQTTGGLQASQGLEADAVADETATRFKGLERASAGKVELLVRIYTETGFKDLYEGLAWMVSNYQDTELSVEYSGSDLRVNPSLWKGNNVCEAESGLSMGDKDTATQSLTAIYTLQKQLKAEQSPLVDNVDVYNTLDRIIQTLDLPSTDEFFNNPEVPESVIRAENEIQKQQIQQLQAAVQQLSQENPLQKAEETKAQAMLVKAESDNKIKLLEAGASQQLSVAKMQEEQRQFNAELIASMDKNQRAIALKLTELDMKYGDDAGSDAGATMSQHE